jgi:coenzyme F420-0:L-glutamate ligase/coenzyme F420-1:gamma-L-glutamate ligase
MIRENQGENRPPIADGAQETWVRALLRGRRSVRRYTAQPIARELLVELLELATWAPSAHNRQPWRFCVVTDPAVKTSLSLAMAAAWRADLHADLHADRQNGNGDDPAAIERRIAISHTRITGAAALVIASLSMIDMDDYPDPARAAAERTMAVQSVALACQNLLLAAHAYGLGACWMCAPLFVPDLVRTILDLPADWEPQALITLGYAAESKSKTRVPLDERVVWRTAP